MDGFGEEELKEAGKEGAHKEELLGLLLGYTDNQEMWADSSPTEGI